MNVPLDLPEYVVSRLNDEARQKGLTLQAYILQLILREQGSNGADEDETAKQRARDEAGRNILELRKGNILGPDITIRELIEEGRRF